NPAMWDAYYDELARLGRPVEHKPIPPRRPTFLHVSEDPEGDWPALRPHALYELEQYQHWGMTGAASYGDMKASEETLRAVHAVWTPEQARDYLLEQQATYPDSIFSFAPILAGMDPEMAQRSLELIAERVLPALHAARIRGANTH